MIKNKQDREKKIKRWESSNRIIDYSALTISSQDSTMFRFILSSIKFTLVVNNVLNKIRIHMDQIPANMRVNSVRFRLDIIPVKDGNTVYLLMYKLIWLKNSLENLSMST